VQESTAPVSPMGPAQLALPGHACDPAWSDEHCFRRYEAKPFVSIVNVPSCLPVTGYSPQATALSTSRFPCNEL
jgi:hypothetical protein